MESVTIEVGGMLSALSVRGIEKQLTKLSGMHKAEVNYVAGSATVVYDETVIDLKAIKARVHECGYHCSGEMLPKHVCVPEDPPANGR
jgi:Cu2+-exporting ATPase